MPEFFCIIPKVSRGTSNQIRLKKYILKECRGYQEVMRTNGGMIVLAKDIMHNRSCISYPLSESMGIIFGVLFKTKNLTTGMNESASVGDLEAEKIISTKGKYLIENYWGRYAAFIQAHNPDTFVVVRDPTGAIPAYFYEDEDFLLFFSNSEDFAKLKLTKLTFNNEHIASHLRVQILDYNDTGFYELKKVNRGESLILQNGIKTFQQYWSPSQFIDRSKTWTAQDAAQALRETVCSCVATWASHFNRISVLLSGGLDSSIMLSCIRRGAPGTEVLALNYYGSAASEDERRWAKLAAEHTDTRLFHHKMDAAQIDVSIVRNFFAHAELAPISAQVNVAKVEKPFSDLHGTEATFLGEGGDAIFYAMGTGSAADYLWYQGFGFDFFRICLEEAIVSGKSAHRILAESLNTFFTGGDRDFFNASSALSSTIYSENSLRSIDLEKRFSHWKLGLKGASRAKQQHVTNCRFVEFSRWPTVENLCHPRIQPLLSQPILELVFSIPCYLFSLGGVSRGLARRAFQDWLPEEIVWRQSKGGGEQYLTDVYTNNLPFYRELLRGGRLVEMGFCDRDLLEEALDPVRSMNTAAASQLLDAAGIEAWVRRWIEIGQADYLRV